MALRKGDLEKAENNIATRRSYSGEFKAKVVYELVNGKENLRELADKYQIHPNQIKNWKSYLFKNAGVILEDRRRKK